MFSALDFWAGLVLPAVLTAGLLLAGWRVARRRMSARDGRSLAGPAALAVGFAAGFAALFGRPGFPPLDAVDWLFFLALPLAVLGMVDALLKLHLPARFALLGVAVPAAFLVLAWPLVSAEGAGGSEAATRTAIAAAAGLVSLAALDAWAARVSAARLSMILLAVAAPAAVVLMLSGSLRLGQIGGLLAATAAGAFAANLVLGSAAIARGAVLVFGTLLGGLLLCGHLYAELTTGDALLLATAPNLAWLASLVPQRVPWLVTVLVQLAAVLGVTGVAVVQAWLRFVEAAA